MSSAFVVEEATAERLTSLGGVVAPSPFFSPAYAAAQRALGSRVLLLVDQSASIPVAALGLLQIGHLTRSLRVEFGPGDANHPFWRGVRELCRDQAIRRLTADTYGNGGELPHWPGEQFRTHSEQFLIDLSGPRNQFSESHRRRVKASLNAGLILRRPVSKDSLGTYRELIEASKDRRQARGERVGASILTAEVLALLHAEAAEIWFAEHDGKPVACVLFIAGPGAAYYAAAGAGPIGLERGAPYFLVDSAIRHFRATGRTILNLGGVPMSAQGLRQFKAGFGSSPVPCEFAQFIVGGPVYRALLQAVDWARAHRWPEAA